MRLSKLVFGLIVLAASSSAFAAKSAIYCKYTADEFYVVYDASTDEGNQECAPHLMQSAACFTGSRSEVIDLINETDTFNWDEEWLGEAKYKGKNEISYKWIDGPNDVKETQTLVRCTKEFFKERLAKPQLQRD